MSRYQKTKNFIKISNFSCRNYYPSSFPISYKFSTAACLSLVEPAEFYESISVDYSKMSSIKLAQILASYANNPKAAYFLFKYTQSNKFQHDLSTYSVIIHILCRSGLHQKLVALFSHLISVNGELGFKVSALFDLLCLGNGVSQSNWLTLVSDSLVKAYVGCKMLDEAICVFHELGSLGFLPSMKTCNFLLNFVVENGNLELAKVLFDRMKDFGIHPDTYMFTIMIKSFFQHGKLEDALEIWGEMEDSGAKHDMVTHTTLISGVCKLDGLDTGFTILKEIIRQGAHIDCVAYNRVISVLCKMKKLNEARKVLDHMAMHGVLPDAISYGHLIKGYCDINALKQAIDLHDEMIKKDIKPTLFLRSIRLNMLCKMDKCSEALTEFEKLKASGDYIDVVLYSIAIKAHCKMKNMMSAFELLKEVIARNLTLDAKLYTTLINGFCEIGEMSCAKRIYFDMQKKNVIPDIVTFNMLGGGFCRYGLVDKAFGLINDMKNVGLEPNSLTYSNYIENLCKGNKLEVAEELYQKLEQTKFHQYIGIHFAMVSGYLICDCIKEAFILFYRLSKQRSFVDENVSLNYKNLVVFSKLFSRLCKENEVEKADYVLKFMPDIKLSPGKEIYNQIIDGYSHIKDVDRAHLVFNDSIKHGVTPDMIMYSTLINGYWRAGRDREARELFDEMVYKKLLHPDVKALTVMLDGYLKELLHKDWPNIDMTARKKEIDILFSKVWKWLNDLDLKPDVIVYNVLVYGYSKVGYIEGAYLVFNDAIKHGVTPDMIMYSTLINGYLRAGRGREAQELFNEMVCKKLLLPDVKALTVMLAGYLKELLHKDRPNIDMTTRKKEIDILFSKVWKLLNDLDLKPDVTVYNVLVYGYSKVGYIEGARKYFGEMIKRGITPNSFHTLLSQSNILHKGKKVKLMP